MLPFIRQFQIKLLAKTFIINTLKTIKIKKYETY